MTDETHLFFKFRKKASYDTLTAAGNTARNLPDEQSERWLALWDKTFLDPETNSDRLYFVKRSGILESDNVDLEGIEEINLETYLQRLSWEPPIEEDLEMEDELLDLPD